MLSTQPSNLPHHRRQNSTPTTPNVTSKVPILPATHGQPTGIHRRGLSLDRPIYTQPKKYISMQDTGSRYTNTGPNEQHLMRVAQTQRLAQPGQYLMQQYHKMTDTQRQRLSGHIESTFQNDLSQLSAMNAKIPQDNIYEQHAQYENFGTSDNAELNILQAFDTNISSECLDGTKDSLSNNVDISEDDTTDEIQNITGSYPTSGKHSVQPNIMEIHRPHTPPSQMSSNYYPLTPATTPFSRDGNVQHIPYSRTAQSSPIRRDRNVTIKAPHTISMKRGLSCQDVFEGTRQISEHPSVQSPPNTVPLPQRSTFDVGPCARPGITDAFKMDFTTQDSEYDSSHYSPMTNRVSPAMSSFQSSPELVHMDLFPELGAKPDFSAAAHLSHSNTSGSALDLRAYPSPSKETSMSRSQSVPDIALDLADATIEETGVSCDDIASFIQGPDEQNKWLCLYPECERRFSRKENIKSHVQTHLGDRQFRCIHCGKCFVRQHDLKRHVKIHSGDKPFACACGNGFARQDALTRHRQRGVCSGAFPDTPRKEIKRGRPKKASRPDTEERLEKAAKTRKRILEKRAYASSTSASSEYSLPSPPEFFDDVDLSPPSPFVELQPMELASFNISPEMFSLTPPTSPGYSTGNRGSPQQSFQSYTPKAEIMSPSPKRRSVTSLLEEDGVTLPILSSPVRGAHSRYGTPPELEISSSSPLASKFFDFDSIADGSESTTQSTIPSENTKSSDSFDLCQMDSQEDDLLFGAFTTAADTTSIAGLERDLDLRPGKGDAGFQTSNGWTDSFSDEQTAFWETF